MRLPHASPRPGHPPHTVCAWLWPRCRCGLRGGHVHGGVCWMRARGRGMTWWARTAQKSGSRLLPNAAVPVWLSSALRTSAMAPEKNLALGPPCMEFLHALDIRTACRSRLQPRCHSNVSRRIYSRGQICMSLSSYSKCNGHDLVLPDLPQLPAADSAHKSRTCCAECDGPAHG